MTDSIDLLTIGFTQKTAEKFFSLLATNHATKIVDTRLKNEGQLAGFSKRADLAYFAHAILKIDYVHWIESAPEEALIRAYKNKEIDWDSFGREYVSTLQSRRIATEAASLIESGTCLLCSEAKPHHCHRSLLADYLAKKLRVPIVVKHLV